MEYLLPIFFLILLSFILLFNLISLPANWAMLVLIFIWSFVYPDSGMSWAYLTGVVCLAVMGEIIEFFAQALGSKKYGSTNSGMFGGIAGAIIGAVLCAPFFFGLGAIFGVLIGAWAGCYIVERLRGRSAKDSWQAAKGSLIGRFLGIVVKFGVGVSILALTWRRVWPVSDIISDNFIIF